MPEKIIQCYLACGTFYEACPEFAEGPPNLAWFSTFYEFIKIEPAKRNAFF